jgi:hypothetical protein
MNKIFSAIYMIFVPEPLRKIIRKKTLKGRILRYFNSLPQEEVNEEQREVLKYLRNNPLSIFPYNFQSHYSPQNIEVFYDDVNRMNYVFLDGKRLYYKKGLSKKNIRKSFSELLGEQDMNSPHRYLTKDFNANNCVIADIGAADGNFSLSVIDTAKKIVLFEYDPKWVKALRLTFAPWKEKIEIISKRVADRDNEKDINFSTFYKTSPDINFLKIDVDGAEEEVLRSCQGALSSGKPMKIALCTYHKDSDESKFTALLQSLGFNVSYSDGYMIYYYDKKMKTSYLRRGLIRATRS